MSALLTAEWIKMRYRWMPRIIVAILLAIIIIAWWVIGARGSRDRIFPPQGLIAVLVVIAALSAFLWPVVAGSWGGNEYGWGTVRTMLSLKPDRVRFTLANLGVLELAMGLALFLGLAVALIAGALVSLLTGHGVVDGSNMDAHVFGVLVKCLIATWYATSFYIVFAFAAGTIFRSAPAGIGLGTGITIAQFIAIPIFFALGDPWKSAAYHFPLFYVRALPGHVAAEVLPKDFSGVGGANIPGVAESIIGLAIYIAIPLALTLLVVRRRDITV